MEALRGDNHPCHRSIAPRGGASVPEGRHTGGRGTEEDAMVPVVTILSEEELQRLHTRALEILERVGIRYESKRCLDILEAAGQRVDHAEGIAWLKPDLVEACIKSTPSVITLGARDPKYDFKTDRSRFY